MKFAAAAASLVFLALASATPGEAVRGVLGVVPGAVVTQPFGCTSVALEPPDPSCPGGHFHSGIDLAAPTGTPVYAATAGRTLVVRSVGGYGLHVMIWGPEGALVIYGHLSEVDVAGGRWVAAGELIGRVGATGNATGPHLHLEVRLAGAPVDPVAWLRGLVPSHVGR
ncbi:MAG: M23 family metallopeptidase [Candidatus Dormibacterales bacterium]